MWKKQQEETNVNCRCTKNALKFVECDVSCAFLHTEIGFFRDSIQEYKNRLSVPIYFCSNKHDDDNIFVRKNLRQNIHFVTFNPSHHCFIYFNI